MGQPLQLDENSLDSYDHNIVLNRQINLDDQNIKNNSNIFLNNVINYSEIQKDSQASNYIKRHECRTNINTREEKRSDENNVGNIYFRVNNTLLKESSKKRKLLGRKKKGDNSETIHNKYADDNMRRKCKHILINNVMEFTNEKLKTLYKGELGNSIFRKQLLTLNKEQKSEASIDYNKNFIHKSIGDIFSDKISSRFTNYLPEHNKLLIQNLVSEKDEEKKKYFNNLFKLTFLDCLNHFRGTQTYEELEGMKSFEDIKSNLNDASDYIELLKYYLFNFEKIIEKKRSRNSNKKKSNIPKKS